MHPNPTFRNIPTSLALDLVRDRAFGILALSTDGAPLLSHVPFILDEAGEVADLHLVRSNPICRVVGDGVSARIAVSGPDGYISPDWYQMDDQVPTWNYIAVHLTGVLRPLPPEDLPALLARQSASFEQRLAPKPPWTMDKLTAETARKLQRMILPYRFEIDDIQNTWKLGQNKPDNARMNAAEALTDGVGSELRALAAAMHSPPETD